MDKVKIDQENSGRRQPGSRTSNAKKSKNEVPTTSHTDHSASLKRLNRIRGQIDAVARMIGERKYCPEILQQIRAAESALRSLEVEILRAHLRGCVKTAFESKNPFSADDKIEEIIKLWDK